jgi:hypothetical protein
MCKGPSGLRRKRCVLRLPAIFALMAAIAACLIALKEVHKWQ